MWINNPNVNQREVSIKQSWDEDEIIDTTICIGCQREGLTVPAINTSGCCEYHLTGGKGRTPKLCKTCNTTFMALKNQRDECPTCTSKKRERYTKEWQHKYNKKRRLEKAK